MTANRMAKGSEVLVRGRRFEIVGRLPKREIRVKDVITEEYRILDERDLIDDLFEGHAELLINGGGDGSDSGDELIKLRKVIDDIRILPEELKIEWRRRLRYVLAVQDKRPRSLAPAKLEPIIESVAKTTEDEGIPSPRTLMRWFKRFVASGEDPRSLVPYPKRGNETRKLSSDPAKCRDVQMLLRASIAEVFMTNQRNSRAAVQNRLKSKIVRANEFREPDAALVCPTYSTICREIERLDKYEVAKARYGKRIADFKYMAVGKGPRPTRILERVEIDHTKADILVIDEEVGLPIGKPWLTNAIDVFSKYCLGYCLGFEPPSYLSVMECLLHSIRPKRYLKTRYPAIKHPWNSYGIPELIVVDNAKEFRSLSFEDACYQIGSNVQFSPVKHPWYKPSVERFFGTLNTQLLHQQPGAELTKILEPSDYDPSKDAIIGLQALNQILHTFIVEVYHESLHRGIGDVPARVWDAGVAVFPPALPRSYKDLDVLLGMTFEKRVGPRGIMLFGLTYNDERLSEFRRRGAKSVSKVRVKLSPGDIGIIHVFDDVKREFFGVPCVTTEYSSGLSIWQHKVIRKYALRRAKSSVNEGDLIRARDHIRELVADAWGKAKKKRTRQRLARWLRYGEDQTGNTGGLIEAEHSTEPYPASALVPPQDVRNERAGISDPKRAIEADREVLADGAENPAQEWADRSEPTRSRSKARTNQGRPSAADSRSVSSDEGINSEGWSSWYLLPN